ncbi:hypothetical protein C7M84_002442 [Penaeus vannamei]|uniref:Oplophorus-luciferin 2-monooxygenase non-catalytic subunit n=1 Tax=Penaeus vannamei TaxID=6689 RepID=A0A423TQX8_PENVA|nr:hypothetical protein C7M84_002442 [Penaeus vannamei]
MSLLDAPINTEHPESGPQCPEGKMAGLHRLLALLALALGTVAVSVPRRPRMLTYDISPCVCTVDVQHNMDIDCSQVESEDQLAQVFSSNIPFPKFNKLLIEGNPHLTVLRNGDLGPASFQIIEMTSGVLEEVQDGALSGVKNVNSIGVEGNGITTVVPGIFSDLPHLRYLYLFSNRLSEIPAGAIEFNGNGFLFLDQNNISKIAVGAITEDVFGAFLSAGATLEIDDNPLGCGCEIAWLVTNSAYMSLISPGASCYDGELLANLDPTIYEDFC